MKILFVAGGSPATIFALTPLATAARHAGHEVFMASNEMMMPTVASAGLPAVSVTSLPIRHFITTDRLGNRVDIPADPAEQARFTGRWFARMAVAGLPALVTLAQDWRPDLVVGGTMCYAAPLLAAHLGIPWVRQAWDAIEATEIHPGADAELRPELDELGLDGLGEPDLFIDICPPSLRPSGAETGKPMRFVPSNSQRRLEPWMYTRGERRRVCVTSGSRVTRSQSYDQNYEFLCGLAKCLTPLDVELVIAAPDDVADDLRGEVGAERAGWFPLDVVGRTCDLLVHHAGGVTTLTGLTAGVPQLLIPRGAVLVAPARRVADHGAAITLAPAEDTPENIATACEKLLSDPTYGERARALSQEIATMPLPAELVGNLEKLIG